MSFFKARFLVRCGVVQGNRCCMLCGHTGWEAPVQSQVAISVSQSILYYCWITISLRLLS